MEIKGSAVKDGIYTTPESVIKIIEGPCDAGWMQKAYEFIKKHLNVT